MPNLLCARPVVILACVPASTSGLTRSAIARGAAHAGGQRRQHVELLGAFDVDLRDVLGQREAEFAFALADAGEHDALRPECRPHGRGAVRRRSPRRRRHPRARTAAAPRAGRWPSSRSGCCASRPASRQRRRRACGSAAHRARRNTPSSACRASSAIACSGTSSITSPSMACMGRCGRAAISSAAVGSATASFRMTARAIRSY